MTQEFSTVFDFIQAMKGQGASDEFVVALLKQKGWSERKVYQAFAEYYEARTGVTTPAKGGLIEAARDTFLYLLAFITLGIWTIDLGALLFTLVDRWVPDAVRPVSPVWTGTEIPNFIAAILVAFPIFLIVSRVISRSVRDQPERLDSAARKWLTYLVLVVTASILIGDAATFLAYLLRGEATPRFILKVVALLVIAGGVFWHYLGAVRPDAGQSARDRWFAWAALALVIASVSAGFVATGSPALQRARTLDQRRLSDLGAIAGTIHGEVLVRPKESFQLPSNLSAPAFAGLNLVDPATAQPYEYIPGAGSSYQLCARFETDGGEGFWRHPIGRHCFTLDARSLAQPPRRR